MRGRTFGLTGESVLLHTAGEFAFDGSPPPVKERKEMSLDRWLP